MSLITYAEVRPWAKAIVRQVGNGVMPPWHADAPHGTFRNERSLTQAQKDVRAGRRRARLKAIHPIFRRFRPSPQAGASASPMRSSQCRRTTPFRRKARSSTSTSTSPRISPRRSGCRRSRPVRGIASWCTMCSCSTRHRQTARAQRRYCSPTEKTAGSLRHSLLRATVPSGERMVSVASWRPTHQEPIRRSSRWEARFVFRRGVLHLQLHYTANGTAGTDRTTVGMIFAKEPPEQEMRVSQFINGRFTIPAGASNHEVSTDVSFAQDATSWDSSRTPTSAASGGTTPSNFPTARARPSFRCRAMTSTGRRLYVPGTAADSLEPAFDRRLGHDNSSANWSNPDPTIDVKWGDQT